MHEPVVVVPRRRFARRALAECLVVLFLMLLAMASEGGACVAPAPADRSVPWEIPPGR